MKIFHRYISGQFLRWLCMCLGAFILIVIIVDLTEHYGQYRDREAQLRDLALYYVYQIPYLVILVLPVAALIACFFSVGTMARHSEITAMKTAGLNLFTILYPLLLLGLMVSVISGIMGGILVPHTNSMVEEIKKTKIHKRSSSHKSDQNNIFLRGGDREKELIYYIRHYDAEEERMNGVHIQGYRDGTLVDRLDAKSGRWRRDKWIFSDGYYRQFGEDGSEVDVPFIHMVLPDLRETPESFRKRRKTPDEMNVLELRDYIHRVSREGGDVHKEKVDYHFRFSFPLANFLIILFGSPLTSTYKRSGMAFGFVISVFVGFVFYALVHAGQSMGHSGVLSPPVGAWGTDMLFFIAGIILFVRELRR